MSAERNGQTAVLRSLVEDHQKQLAASKVAEEVSLSGRDHQHVSAAKVQSWYRSQLARRVMREMVQAHWRSQHVTASAVEGIRMQHEAELDSCQLEIAEWQSKLEQKHAEGLQGMLRVRAEDDAKLKAVRGEAQAWEQAFHQQRNMAEQHAMELAQYKVQCATQLQRIQKASGSPRAAGFARTAGGVGSPVRAQNVPDTLEGRLRASDLGKLTQPLAEAGYDELDILQGMNDADWADLAEELGREHIDERSLNELRACVAGPRPPIASTKSDVAGSPRRDLVADLTADEGIGSAEELAERLQVAEKLLAEAMRAKTDAEASAEARTRELRVQNVQLKRDQLQLKAELSKKVDSYLLELI